MDVGKRNKKYKKNPSRQQQKTPQNNGGGTASGCINGIFRKTRVQEHKIFLLSSSSPIFVKIYTTIISIIA